MKEKSSNNIPIKMESGIAEVQMSVSFLQTILTMRAVQIHPIYVWKRGNYIMENVLK